MNHCLFVETVLFADVMENEISNDPLSELKVPLSGSRLIDRSLLQISGEGRVGRTLSRDKNFVFLMSKCVYSAFPGRRTIDGMNNGRSAGVERDHPEDRTPGTGCRSRVRWNRSTPAAGTAKNPAPTVPGIRPRERKYPAAARPWPSASS